MAVKPKEATPAPITVVTTCNLYEPYAEIRFTAALPVEVSEITPWMESQIEAGIMQVI